MRGRAQYVTLQWTPQIKIGIINVYAFNYTGSRARLWNKIKTFPLPQANWLLGGDFNIIYQLSDKLGSQPSTGKGPCELTWGELQIHLGISNCFSADEFRKLTPKTFSWDNRRAAPDMICSRLDRLYLNQQLIRIGGQTAIWPTLAHVSDHAPSWIRNSQTAFVPGRCIFDNIFMAQSAMDWAVESNQPLIILLLDLEKAYDRVSWTFLQQTMLHIGFHKSGLTWSCLYAMMHQQEFCSMNTP